MTRFKKLSICDIDIFDIDKDIKYVITILLFDWLSQLSFQSIFISIFYHFIHKRIIRIMIFRENGLKRCSRWHLNCFLHVVWHILENNLAFTWSLGFGKNVDIKIKARIARNSTIILILLRQIVFWAFYGLVTVDLTMCRGHDYPFSGQSALPSLPIYHQCAAHVPLHFQFLDKFCIFSLFLWPKFQLSRRKFAKFSFP